MAATLAEAFEEICQLDAPLSVRLAAYEAKLRELNFPFAEAYDALVARLMAGEIGKAAPDVGEEMPNFILPAKGGQLLSLEELVQRGPVVVSFNRGHWCSFCKIELRAFAEYHDAISALGASIVSIIPDTQEFASEVRRATLDRLHVVSDVDNGYALSLGLVMWLGEDLKSLMIGRGYHLETYQGAGGWFVPVPATFVVDRRRIVCASTVDPDFRRRMDIDIILNVLRRLADE